MIELGQHVKDKLTLFEGIAVARAEYLYGCVWIQVVPLDLHEGKPIEDAWFDEQRLTTETRYEEVPKRVLLDTRLGGPMPSMPKHRMPTPNKKY